MNSNCQYCSVWRMFSLSLLLLIILMGCMYQRTASRLDIREKMETPRQRRVHSHSKKCCRNDTSTSIPSKPALSTSVLSDGNGTESESLWDSVGCESAHPLLVCSRDASVGTNGLDTMATKATFSHDLHLLMRHNTCALVGSSGNLKNHKFGKEIDQRDLVIRVNNPPIEGYERFVGQRRGDVMVVNNMLSRCITTNRPSTLYLRPMSRVLSSQQPFVRHCHPEKVIQMYSLSRYVEGMAQKALKNYTQRYNIKHKKQYGVTSGFRALFFSLLVCREVHAYGFGVKDAKTFHYYTTKTNYKRPSYHHMDLEVTIMQTMANGSFAASGVDLSWKGFGRLYVH